MPIAVQEPYSVGITTPSQHAKIDALEAEMRLMPPCVAQEDFREMLSEIGWTEYAVSEDMRITGYAPEEDYETGVAIKKSPIHGVGCFATKNYRAGDRVCIVRYHDQKTAEGRFMNHSPQHNAEFVIVGDEAHAFATENISEDQEILVNYRQSFSLAMNPPIGPTDTSYVEKLEAWLSILPQEPEDLRHEFTEGVYIRQSTIGAGAIFTTETHKIDHAFALTEGEAFVWCKQDGWKLFTAPLLGMTKAGTKRVVITKSKCVMTTFHPNPDNNTNLDGVWDRLYEKRRPPSNLMSGDVEEVHAFMKLAGKAFTGECTLAALNDWKQYAITNQISHK